MKSRLLSPIAFSTSCGLTILVGGLFLHGSRPDIYSALTSEGSIIENLTSIFYLFSSTLFFLGAYFFRKNQSSHKWKFRIWLGMAMMFAFIGLEECNWGQVFWNFKTLPWFKNRGMQNEIGFHNLIVFHSLIHPHRLFVLFALSFGVFFPWIRKFWVRMNKKWANLPLPSMELVPLFTLGAMYNHIGVLWSEWLGQNNSLFYVNHAEIAEFAVGLGVFLFSVSHLPTLKAGLLVLRVSSLNPVLSLKKPA